MVAQIEGSAAEALRGYSPPAQSSQVVPSWMPFLTRGIVMALIPILLLISVAVTLARGQVGPSVAELPLEYLPGNALPRLPEGADCYSEGVAETCRLKLGEQDVTIQYQNGTHMILRTSIRISEYPVGQLVLNWGEPDGVIPLSDSVLIHWGKQSVVIDTAVLQPDSPVAWIVYDFEPQAGDRWQGFRRYTMHS